MFSYYELSTTSRLCLLALYISNDLQKILGCYGFKGLFLTGGNMGYEDDSSAKYPNVSKLHFWNSSGGPYTTGAVHVSVTAVAEAQQT